MSDFGYQVGDVIYIFNGRHSGFIAGHVAKVTPTGRVSVKVTNECGLRAFTNRGDEVGNSGGRFYSGPCIIEKSKQDALAESIRIENRAKNERHELRDGLEALSRVRLDDDSRQGIVLGLRALADKLEQAK